MEKLIYIKEYYHKIISGGEAIGTNINNKELMNSAPAPKFE